MKKYSVLTLLMLFFCSALLAQKDYRVVFDLTSKDTAAQQSVIRWAKEVVKADPDAKVEIVMFGQGLALVVKDRSAFADEVISLAKNKNVAFRACSIALKNQNITNDQLLPGVGTVPDGIYEIISKQRGGWGYIKVATK
jgi:uncharacterized protein